MSWYSKNKEKVLERVRKYKEENKEKYLAYQKEYYENVLKEKRKAERMEASEKRAKECQVKTITVDNKPVEVKVRKPRQKRERTQTIVEEPIKKKKQTRKFEPTFTRSIGEYVVSFD